jgi:hypothetical protein
VLVRRLCPLVLGILILSGCGHGEPGDGTSINNAEGVTRNIAGSWIATLHQEGLPPFQIGVTIAANGRARVAYTGIRCGGDWNLDQAVPSIPPRYVFTETITEGAGGDCKGTGTVSLSPIQRHSPNEPAYTRLNYRFTGGGVSSLGLLRRSHDPALLPLFKEARVTPP